MKFNYRLIFFPVLLGTFLVGLPKVTMAQVSPVIEELPPLPDRPLPNPSPNSQPPNSTFSNPSSANLYRYRVFIDGTNPSLRARVRTFIPDAFIPRGRGVIQVGAFREEDRFKAELRLQELAARGITARIVDANTGQSVSFSGNQSVSNNPFGQPNPGFNNPPFPNTFPSNNTDDNSPSNASPYFVIIPGGLEDLPNIAGQVANLGISQELIRQREAPRGPHVIVGPFSDRGLAQQWENYLRDADLDARVHFEK